MAPISNQTRLAQGCGFLPRSENARPGFGIPLEADVEATVCPGYSIGLPEVVEVVDCRPDWQKGCLTEYLEDAPSPHLLRGLKILDGAVTRFQSYEVERRRKEAERARG